MILPALFALGLLAAGPVDVPAGAAPAPQPAAQSAPALNDESDDDIPSGVPTDDYGFVAWCYGALDEYLTIYEEVKPDLKAIDKLFGTPVKEDEPYSADIAAARVALKQFGASLDAAERASATPIAEQGAAEIQAGREIWTVARMEPRRKLADAWLFWGVPTKCETSAKALRSREPEPGQVATEAPPSAVVLAGPDAPPLPASAEATSGDESAGAPQHAGAVLIDPK